MSQLDALAGLLASEADVRTKYNTAVEIRDSADSFQGADYAQFVAKIVPEILRLLSEGGVPISFNAASYEQRLRCALLEILVRIQANDVLKPHAIALSELIMHLLRHDNEDIGVLCMKVVTNLHRAYKMHLKDYVQPFLDLALEIYKNAPQVVEDLFGEGSAGANATATNSSSIATPNAVGTPGASLSPAGDILGEASGAAAAAAAAARPVPRSLHSFKVLTECPIIIVLLYSTHKEILNASLRQFIPHIIDMLGLQAAPQAKQHALAEARGEVFTGLAPQIKNRALYGEFIVAQVKTMSFLAYALRGFSPALQRYQEAIPEYVVRLLQDCPCELSSARKELLVATRHILNTDSRTIFIPKVDVLLNEKVLIGDGLTVHESLRPLAYSTIADLVHHVRADLTSPQIWKTVKVYCRNMQDETLATSFQIMSAKLLLNLIDRIMKLPDRAEARQVLILILSAFVERFTSLNRTYPHISKVYRQSRPNDQSTVPDDTKMEVDPSFSAEELDYYDVLNFDIIKIQNDTHNMDVKEARYTFKNLMNFLKTVMFGLKSVNPPSPGPEISAVTWGESARSFNYEQVTIFRRLFREGINGFLFYAIDRVDSPVSEESPKKALDDKSKDKASDKSIGPTSKDEKELMETFATVFIHVDSSSLAEVLSLELPFLYEAAFANPAILHIAQFFLASESSSVNYAGHMISFLKSKLPELGQGDAAKTSLLVRLFKITFMAVNLFPAANEANMLPHLKDLIIGCLELTSTAKEPLVYFQLLRTLFRSIGGGRFELLYKEVLPLLQVVLDSLNKLLASARKQEDKDIYVELCLTVPVRLSVLVPHLSFLMQPLVMALNGNPELVTQGLRTLELCVDNLTAEYFDPIIEPVLDQIMEALWRHLKPLPYNHHHSHTTLRVLGKLGGRNRRFLKAPAVHSISVFDNDTAVLLEFDGLTKRQPLRLAAGVKVALEVLDSANGENTLHYQRQAFLYLSAVIKLFVDVSPVPDDMAQRISHCVAAILDPDYSDIQDVLPSGRDTDVKKRRLQSDLAEQVMCGLFVCASVPELHDDVSALIKDLCEHFCIIELQEFIVEKRKTLAPFRIDEHDGEPFLDPKGLVEAVMFALSHYKEGVQEAGAEAIRAVFQCGLAVMGSHEVMLKFPLFRTLFGKLSHSCFESAYYRKAGACYGLKIMIKELTLPTSWLSQRQMEFARTMLFVLKDVPADVPAQVRDEAKDLLYHVLNVCNDCDDKEERERMVSERPFKQLVGLLAYELANANANVREAAKESLAILAKHHETTVGELLRPVKSILLAPIYGKPLRALPFPLQIGYIDAVTFCLSLPDDGLMEFSDELTRLLLEALALVEAEDESLTSAHRAFEYRTAEQLVQLRIVSIRLLSLALTKTADNAQMQQALNRGKIIAAFFKTLYARSPKVIAAAHSGLAQVFAQNVKLPRELLQNGLRPILMNLSDHKRLTVAGLEGLARLLELLTSYFKVEIGRKLLDHLKAWAEPGILHKHSLRALDGAHNVKIIVAILNVFELLPASAHVFMPELMQVLFYLEAQTRHEHASPFREPIAKFLNRYPNEAVEYFVTKMADRAHGRFFADVLGLEVCSKLNQQVRQSFDRFRAVVFDEKTDQEMPPGDAASAKAVSICNFVALFAALAAGERSWLVDQREVLDQVNLSSISLVRTPGQVPLFSPVPLQIDLALAELQRLYVVYFEERPQDTDAVFMLVNTICTLNIAISWDVKRYVFEKIACATEKEVRHDYLVKCLESVGNRNYSLASRTFLFRHVVNAVLIVEGNRNGNLAGLLDKCSGTAKGSTWLDAVHAKIWRTYNADSEDTANGTLDYYRLELLKMSALVLKFSPGLVADARKDIIKFGWGFIKMDDVVSKQAAYVVTAYFIAAYDTLAKIVVQIYVALLKAHQPEAKTLVRQALDLVAPVLPKRVATTVWAKWPRKVLAEEGYSVANVVNVYAFIVRHPDLFFEYRDHYVHYIISAIPKLCFVQHAPNEYPPLAMDLMELVLKWEVMARDRAQELGMEDLKISEGGGVSPKVGEKRKMEDVEKDEKEEGQKKEVFQVPQQQRDSFVTYLIRFVSSSQRKSSENPLGVRAKLVFERIIDRTVWPDVTVKLSFFERALVHNDMHDEAHQVAAHNALEVIVTTLEQKSASWILDNLHHLERLLEKCARSDNMELHYALEKVLSRVFEAIKQATQDLDDTPDSVSTFVALITGAISEHLASNGFVAGIILCCSLAKYKDTALDGLLPQILKVLNKIYRDHVSEEGEKGIAAATAATSTSSLNGTGATSAANGTTNGVSGVAANGNTTAEKLTSKQAMTLLDKALDFTAARVSHLGDQRRVFLSLVAQLIERADKAMCLKIIAMTRAWVFSKTESFPTVKEKAAILTKMMMFELRGDSELMTQFYGIVVDIYSDPALAHTELAVRMEQPFLVGTRIELVETRRRLMDILGGSLNTNVFKRLRYVLSDQNWEYLADFQWLKQGLELVYGSISKDQKGLKLGETDCRTLPLHAIDDALPKKAQDPGFEAPDAISAIVQRRKAFIRHISSVSGQDVVQPLVELQFKSAWLVHYMWVHLFPLIYGEVPARDRTDMIRAMVALMSKEHHNKQIGQRYNVVQTLLEAAGPCAQLPPHMVKYLGMAFNGWYAAFEILENVEASPFTDSQKVAESNLDALAEVYAGLQEDDMFYGLWRRRSKYGETNAGLSYEQIGLWSRAMQYYEAAQIKARAGALPYGEAEYAVWEDHWILCAQKLQQWEVLTELAKHEGFTDLLLECGWRVADWSADRDPLEQSLKTVMDVPTPRRQVFESFMCLQQFAHKLDSMAELTRLCDEGVQLSLRKWASLPHDNITAAHIPLLHTFQQYVEFMEASQLYTSLGSTTAQNLDTKSQELKGVLQAWRERLPNVWDDINIWGDLVTWRQHAFGVINKVYLPLLPALQNQNSGQGNGGPSGQSGSYAYRGYHEIAWIINRFAHVARQHSMPEVCIGQLTKIYTLPNIEIQEAFLKLREQAKCHYQNPNEMNTGLDVISNTNLVYFGAQQKAEFFTLKGMFLAKLNALDAANQAFATAVQVDLYLPKAWAQWGYYNDRRFRDQPGEFVFASNAISCYLQAAGLYKNGKTRKLLGRILWLISLDDPSNAIGEAFDNYGGEMPVWYWITFIPQLLTALSHREAKLARHVLIRIARSYPQALHFHLRTTKEDFAVLQRQAQQVNANANTGAGPAGTGSANASSPGNNQPANNQAASSQPAAAGGTPAAASSPGAGTSPSSPANNTANANTAPRQPWEHVDEILGILKTAYPLLALSLETLVDQMYQRFKSPVDEDAYRLIVALYNDGVSYLGRLPNPKADAKLPPATESSISRFAENVFPDHIRAAFEADFVAEKPNLDTYLKHLRRWRDRFEEKLDARPAKVNLEALSPHLSEFHYQKFEDVEVPGQYFEHKDSNTHFVKLERFVPTVDLVRGFGVCSRRTTMLGHDGSVHPFVVQYPSARHSRREERVSQLFKILNTVLPFNKEVRRRAIQFTLPVAIPMMPHIRLVQDRPAFTSMYHIYEEYCRKSGMSRDAPLELAISKLRAAFDPKLPKPDVGAIKMEILNTTQATLVPSTVLRDYFSSNLTSFASFWLFRKQFALQYATVTFMTFVLSINNRYPHKFQVDLGSGDVWASEMLPALPPQKNNPVFHNTEPVPFRLTPNIQTLMGPTATEGIYAVVIQVIARALSEPEFDLDQYLSIFVRDELISWYSAQHRPAVADAQLRELVKTNVDTITRRATSLAQASHGTAPANQQVLDMISQAVNPRNLAQTDNLWMPYL